MMTKQVSLAKDTYARLKRAKRPGESFRKATERLLDHQPKDSTSFERLVPRASISSKEWLAQIEADRDTTWTFSSPSVTPIS